MPIRKLSALLISQIAAGEVIERPASVVKELVENSLDAGASRIDVTVEDGGRTLIRIVDDGCGIPADELPLAIAAHATSKLQTPEQLAAIRTMGFRGEALASVASVSRLRLTSRATVDGQPAEAGAMLEAAGAEVSPVQPAAIAPGTIVEVRDLFFNTPARRKFMRSAVTEFGHITETLERIALVRHEVSFTLTHHDRKVLDLPATTDRRLRCVAVLGRELDEALLEFSQQMDEVSVWGLCGLPAIARATAKFQYLYVNQRPVRDRNVQHAMKEAYRGLMMPDLQPVVVLFLDMPFEMVDVNVHPAKSEVRFVEPSRIHGLVLTAIRQRLLATDLTPSAELGRSGLEIRPGTESGAAAGAGTGTPGLPPQPANLSPQSFVDYFKRMAPVQKGLVLEEVKKALAEDQPLLAQTAANWPGGTPMAAPPSPPTPRAQPVLQVHNAYVVTQDEQGLVIIDQHALHERMMFEELSRRILGGGKLESQRLLMPATIPTTARRTALLEELQPLLTRLGIEAELLGPAALGVQAFPTFLFDRGVDPATFMIELLDKAEAGELKIDATEAALHKVLDMMACKAAVKAGDRLSEAELAALLAKREEVERASSCPHGRPTTIRLTLRDLEKHFKRVL